MCSMITWKRHITITNSLRHINENEEPDTIRFNSKIFILLLFMKTNPTFFNILIKKKNKLNIVHTSLCEDASRISKKLKIMLIDKKERPVFIKIK